MTLKSFIYRKSCGLVHALLWDYLVCAPLGSTKEVSSCSKSWCYLQSLYKEIIVLLTTRRRVIHSEQVNVYF